MADRYFLDSNILLYAVRPDSPKANRALALVTSGHVVISAQVLNEFVNVSSKKYKMPPAAIADALEPLKHVCEVVSVTAETHRLALETFGATNFGIYDSCIIAAAELSGCDVLYTEDMNHGQRIGRVQLRNPFI